MDSDAVAKLRSSGGDHAMPSDMHIKLTDGDAALLRPGYCAGLAVLYDSGFSPGGKASRS